MKAVVFDMDGVIFDSEALAIEMWKVVADKYHIPDIEILYKDCLGTSEVVTKEMFLKYYGQDFPYDEYKAEMSILFQENAAGGNLPQKPGLKELLEYLKSHGIKTAVATSTIQEAALKELEEGGLLEYFDEIVCGDMVNRSKPAPDIYLEALRKLQIEQKEVFAIEDSYNGIRAASAAGLRPIMVPDLSAPTEEMKNLAECILPSLNDVKDYFRNIVGQKLKKQITKSNAVALTHNGKFHADDVFSAALLMYLNPEIRIIRENRVPEEFDGIIFDIGRGTYDHHQKNSRVRDNGIGYAAFGLLWEDLGRGILGNELAEQFDISFVQPLDNNDNTGDKNELASLIGGFNPTWDAEDNNDTAFFQAVSVAGLVLDHKFERYLGNERADKRIDQMLEKHDMELGSLTDEDRRILVLPEFIPCQKRLSESDIAFVIFPSNRGGYCVQPQKKEYSMNYKCCFPSEWLGLESQKLEEVTGLKSAVFCHKGGFLMTTGTLEDAEEACRISLRCFSDEPVIVNLGGGEEADFLLRQLPHMKNSRIQHIALPELPELETDGIYGDITLDKSQWKAMIKAQVKKILKYKPEAVYVEGNVFETYPVVHAFRKKHIPVLTMVQSDKKKIIMRIPSGS